MIFAPGPWHAEPDGCSSAGTTVDLGELIRGAGEADLQSFDLAEPALLLGFGDPVEQVFADGHDAVALVGVGPQQAASQTAVLVHAAGSVGPAAVAQGDAAAFEVAEELLPFRLRRGRYSSLGQVARRRAMNAVAVDDFSG